MPVSKTAKRRLRKSQRRRERNLYHLTRMKHAIRLFKKKLTEVEKNKQEITDELKNELSEELRKVISLVSHVAGKGVIHKNEARRRISRLTKLFNKVVQGKSK